MYTGLFINAVLGFTFAGMLADGDAKIMIQNNKGVYEPDFRIFLVLAQLVSGCAGPYGFRIPADTAWLSMAGFGPTFSMRSK